MSDQKSHTNTEEGGDDGKLLFLQTFKFMWKNAKRSKKDFGEFVMYYNEHKAELHLDDDEFCALKELREMWNQINELTDMNFYVSMKEKHTILNGRLLVGEKGIQKDGLWGKYIINFQAWRGRAMVLHYQFLKGIGDIQGPSGHNSMASEPNGTGTPEAKK